MSTLGTVFSLYRERRRQIREEGYTVEHDDQHAGGELTQAAVSYILGDLKRWPWGHRTFKLVPDSRIRELEKAGALIVAEMDRLKREKRYSGRIAKHHPKPERTVRGRHGRDSGKVA